MEITKVQLPLKVAEAIEKYWSNYVQSTGFPYAKHSICTDWHSMSLYDKDIYNTLHGYFIENPIEYIQAIVNGYEIR